MLLFLHTALPPKSATLYSERCRLTLRGWRKRSQNFHCLYPRCHQDPSALWIFSISRQREVWGNRYRSLVVVGQQTLASPLPRLVSWQPTRLYETTESTHKTCGLENCCEGTVTCRVNEIRAPVPFSLSEINIETLISVQSSASCPCTGQVSE